MRIATWFNYDDQWIFLIVSSKWRFEKWLGTNFNENTRESMCKGPEARRTCEWLGVGKGTSVEIGELRKYKTTEDFVDYDKTVLL